MSKERIFEYGGCWLVRRPDTLNYSIAWWPDEPGARRILRVAAGTADLEEAKRKLIEFADAGRHRVPVLNSTQIGEVAPRPVALPTSRQAVHLADPMVLDLLADYVERLVDRPSFEKAAKPMLKHWAEFAVKFDLLYVSELTLEAQERYVAWRREAIERWRNGIGGRGASSPRSSNGTINRELGLLKAALRDAWKRRKLPSVPYILSLPSPPSRDRFLTVEEAQRLLAECHEPHLRRFVLLALHTLQRPIAILSLQSSQVDLANGRIDFLGPGQVQSKKRRPVVPITETLRPELEIAIQESLSGYVVEWMGLPVKSVRTTFNKACERAGLRAVSPYVLRHTGATLLAANGVPMRQVAGMLGHTHERTTELYAKHRPEFLVEAARALDGMFGPPMNSPPIAA